MPNAPQVGIVILNFNKSAYTIDCVNSIVQNEDYPNFIIVVVDNNSPDNKEKELLKEKIQPQTHLIFNPVNGGYAAGNNIGAKYLIEKFQTPFIFILNNDSLINKPVIKKLVESIEPVTDLVAVSPLVLSEYNKQNWQNTIQVRRLPKVIDLMICNTSFLSKVFKKKTMDYLYQDKMPYERTIYTVETINGAAFLIKSDFLKELGYLDERTFLYYEELILGVQIKMQKQKCVLNTNAEIIHFQGVSTNSNDKSFPYNMFIYHLSSFKLLLKEYYKVSFFTITFFTFYRHIEYRLKIALLWLMKRF